MTKSEIVSLVRSRLETDRSPNVYRRRVYRGALLEAYIQSVYEQMYNELYLQDKKKVARQASVVTETVSGDDDLSDGRDLVKKPVSLKRNSIGIFRAEVNGSELLLTSYDTYKNHVDDEYDTSGFMGKHIGAISGNKLYANTTATDGSSIIYHMIPKFSELESTDEVAVPSGLEDHFIDRIMSTLVENGMSGDMRQSLR